MILMGMVKHSKRSQNSKFAMSLQYLKKEVDFVHADKHQSFLLFFMEVVRHAQSTQNRKLAIFL